MRPAPALQKTPIWSLSVVVPSPKLISSTFEPLFSGADFFPFLLLPLAFLREPIGTFFPRTAFFSQGFFLGTLTPHHSVTVVSFLPGATLSGYLPFS